MPRIPARTPGTYGAYHQHLFGELTKLAEGGFPPDEFVIPHELFAEALMELLSISLRLEEYALEGIPIEGEIKTHL